MSTSLLRLAARLGCATLTFAGLAPAQQPTLERFVVPGADVTYARGIDSQGGVAGSYVLPGGNFRGYLRDASGTIQLLDYPSATVTILEGLTNGGTAVGFAAGPGSLGPVEYTSGTWTTLTPPGPVSVFLHGGNDAGLRVGHLIAQDASRHGVLFTNGVPTLLDFPGALATELEDVNASGVVIGNYRRDLVSPWSGFVHDLSGGTFSTLNAPGEAATRLLGMNDLGDIVGEVLPNNGGERRAVRYSGGQWTLLDLFGALGATQASDIANDGRICGDYYGQFDGAPAVLGYVLDPNGAGPSVYCQANANSSGDAADIHYVGSASIAANDLVLEAGRAPANVSGLFFYGPNLSQAPFGDGFLCVGAPQFRLATGTPDASGFARHAFDVTAPPSPNGQVTAGTRWHFQYWFRDTAAMGSGFNTSRALAVDFTP